MKDQWVFYQKEKIPNEWYQDSLIKNFKCQDSYWSKIFDVKSEVSSKNLTYEISKKLFVITP